MHVYLNGICSCKRVTEVKGKCPAGFSMLHSAESGMWGRGTYFSARAKLAKGYAYKDYAPSFGSMVRQMLVAEVLTGKSKMMKADPKLQMPPVLEDGSLVRSEFKAPHCTVFT